MTGTGLDVFDKTVQTTNVWLNEVSEQIGPDRHLAWHVLGVGLRALRDRLPVDDAAHLGAELPLMIRGAYYDQFRPATQPETIRSRDEFLHKVAGGLSDTRPVNPETAMRAVLTVLCRHMPAGQVNKTRDALPKDIRTLWPEGDGNAHQGRATSGT
jgi:uncharacterized protein (DUF2267 family)